MRRDSGYDPDYRYGDDARARDLRIVWECDKCHEQREAPPGYNEGGVCHCGGMYRQAGESYLAEARW